MAPAFVCVLHATKPVRVVAAEAPALLTGHALAQQTIRHGERQDPFPGQLLRLYEVRWGAGAGRGYAGVHFGLPHQISPPVRVAVCRREPVRDALAQSVLCHRGAHQLPLLARGAWVRPDGGPFRLSSQPILFHNAAVGVQALAVEDIVPPLRHAVLLALTPRRRHAPSMLRFSLRYAALAVPGLPPAGVHSPPLAGASDLHCPVGPAYVAGEGPREYWRLVAGALQHRDGGEADDDDAEEGADGEEDGAAAATAAADRVAGDAASIAQPGGGAGDY